MAWHERLKVSCCSQAGTRKSCVIGRQRTPCGRRGTTPASPSGEAEGRDLCAGRRGGDCSESAVAGRPDLSSWSVRRAALNLLRRASHPRWRSRGALRLCQGLSGPRDTSSVTRASNFLLQGVNQTRSAHDSPPCLPCDRVPPCFLRDGREGSFITRSLLENPRAATHAEVIDLRVRAAAHRTVWLCRMALHVRRAPVNARACGRQQ